MSVKESLNPEDELIECRRQTIRRVMEDRTARDIEYGYYKGCLGGVQCLKDRKEQVDKDLSCDMRFCPAFGPIRYGMTTPNCLILLHGPEGCAFWHKSLFSGAGAFFLMPMWPVITTAMGQEDVFFGGEEALRRAIINADKYYRPDIIAPVNTCAGSIIGDDIEGVCEALREDVQSYLVPISLPGFSSRNQMLGYERFLTSLAEHIMVEPKEKSPNTINYVGETFGVYHADAPFITDTQEIERVLHEMGVRVISYLPGDGAEKIREAPRAQLNVLRCMGSGLSMARYMKERFDTDYMATCVPIGLQATTEFYMGIIEGLGLGKEADRVIQREIKEAEEALKPYKEAFRGKRFALAASAGRTTSLALLFMELGMEPTFICWNYVREKTFPNMETLRMACQERGFEPEIAVEPPLYEIEAMTHYHKPDIFFLDYHEKAMAIHLGIPAVEIMGISFVGPWMGYRGAVNMAQLGLAGLKNPLWWRKGPRLVPKPFSSHRYLEREKKKRELCL